MLLLKYQISHFLAQNLSRLPNYLDNKQIITLSLFSIYGKISSCKKSKKCTEQILMKMHHRHKDIHMDRRTGLILQDPYQKVVHLEFELGFLEIPEKNLEIINTRKTNTINVADPLINPLIFISFCYHESVHCNKEFSHGNSKSCCAFQIRAC